MKLEIYLNSYADDYNDELRRVGDDALAGYGYYVKLPEVLSWLENILNRAQPSGIVNQQCRCGRCRNARIAIDDIKKMRQIIEKQNRLKGGLNE